ncbi:MAG: glycosyltransferase [Bacteroidales bacterium]|jgi:glycosyltransferase involved in cell wall biosynthesis|nr:glycosyltransferase [Bacteroidales bacterium]
MNNPLISIITVVYNGASTLEQTILSVINQTYKNIEYIIIDGGSTDGTVDIIKKYEKHLACWVSEPDKGIYDAMNKGIDKVTGDWINFMNSGDTFSSNDIIQQLFIQDLFHNHKSIIYGNRIVKQNDGLLKQESRLNTIKYRMDIFHQSCFVPTFLHKNTKFDISYKIAGDYDFFYKMIDDNVQFIKTDLYLCIFLYGGISSNEVNQQIKEVMQVINTHNNSCFHKSKYLFLSISYEYYIARFLKTYMPFIYKFVKKHLKK